MVANFAANFADKVAVLLVDDRPENLTALDAVLGDQGIDLVMAASGNDALLQTLKRDFALVLLDVQMPGMNGFETAELMRTNPKTRHLPIIFITAGMSDPQLLFQGYDLGAVDYLIKPFEPHVLQSKVKVFCDLYRQRRELEAQRAVLEAEIAEHALTDEKLNASYRELSKLAAHLEILRAEGQKLQEADRRKDEFLAMLAHELRNPLVPIRNAAQVIGRLGLEEPKVKWAQEVIENRVAHLTRMVDDLLDVSRIAHDKIVLKKETVELAALIEQVMASAQPLAEGKGHRLSARLPDQAAWLEGDLVRLSQVLVNLVDNAVKYTPNGGQIELCAKMTGAEIEISVRDNGSGIPPTLLPRVFDLFQQDERTLDRANGGLGIGLTLVQQLIGKHGGRVEAHSDGLGRGSTFTVWLPARVAPVLAADAAGDVGKTPAGTRVLVVDDDYDVAESTAMLLDLEGFEARIAHTGQEALELVPEFMPQVVLLDIGLKGMDGFETAKRLRALPDGQRLNLVALTGYGDAKTRASALESGCDNFLVKPMEWHALNKILSAYAVGP